MSMALCDLCRALIDTDDDPEACVHDGYICEPCREPSEAERAPPTRQQYEETMAEWAMDEERAVR